MRSFGGKIISLEEFAKLRPTLGKVVATSGGFDPIRNPAMYFYSGKRVSEADWRL